MQIILVSRGRKGPKTFDLNRWTTRCALVGVLIGSGLCMAGLGAGMALAWSDPHVGVSPGPVDAQDENDPDPKAQRELQALTQKLGHLQAQAVRLHALGERLSQAGSLEGGEFAIDDGAAKASVDAEPDTPALDEPSVEARPTLAQGIDELTSRFDGQQAQFEALYDVLMDQSVDSLLRPAGMPVKGRISSHFGGRADPFTGHGARHAGIDIAAPRGTPVTAVAEGMVVFSGRRSGYGDVVDVDHGNGYMTRYAHNSALVAHEGERVHVGQTIARAGSSGRSTGSHLHFEVWYRQRPVNPLAYVRSRR